MDVSIRSRLGGTFSLSSRSSSGQNTSARVNTSPGAQQGLESLQAPSFLKSDAVQVNSASARSIEELASRAANATVQISELRRKQYDYANQAQYLAEGDPIAENLQALYDEAQSEIERIASSTTYNGVNALQAATYEAGAYNRSGTVIVSIPDTSSLATDHELTLTDPDNAASAQATLSSAALGASTLSKAAETRADAAAKKQNGVSLTASTESSGVGSEIEEAQKKVQEKTQEIVSTLGITSTLPVEELISSAVEADEETDTEEQEDE